MSGPMVCKADVFGNVCRQVICQAMSGVCQARCPSMCQARCAGICRDVGLQSWLQRPGSFETPRTVHAEEHAAKSR